MMTFASITGDVSAGSLVLATSPNMLVSVWKPLVFLAVLACWAWIITKRYDKHAAKFFLPRQNWNAFHMFVGLVAVLLAFLMPVPGLAGFFAGLGGMVLLLSISLFAYASSTSRDERVPAEHRIGLKNLLGGTFEVKEKVDPAAKTQVKVRLTITGPDKQPVAPPQGTSPEAAVRTAAEDLFIKALDSRASQVDITPAANNQYEASGLVDGMKTQMAMLQPPDAVKMMDFWKVAAKLDLADRRKRLTNLVTIDRGTDRKAVRVTSQGVQGGMRLQLLIDPEGQVKRKGEALGFLDEQVPMIKEMTGGVRGLVLLGGLPDGGRTTLFLSMLGMHDAYTQTVQTMEMEIQAQLEGVRHQAFDPNLEGADYATQTRSMLRRDPTVMGVAEIPDAPTAKEVSKADFQRCRLYAMVRAGSALEAIDGWCKAVGDPEQAAKNLQYVVVQRLMRKLCTNCRVPYPASPELLAKLGVGAGQKGPEQLFKKGGQVLIKNKPVECPMCRGIGYHEQTGVFEVVQIDDEIRELIGSGNMSAVKAALKKRGMITMQAAAIRKALAGLTSVEEVMRVTAPAAAPAPAAAKA